MKNPFRAKKHIVITGASGFIGYHLAKRIIETTEDHVTLFAPAFNRDLATVIMEAKAGGRVAVRYADLSLEFKYVVPEGFPPVSHIYHLAARKATTTTGFDFEDFAVNTSMTFNVLEALTNFSKGFPGRAKAKFIFLSTCEVWGGLADADCDVTGDEESAVGINPSKESQLYALSKIVDEQMIMRSGMKNPWTIVRLQNPYGPRMGNVGLIPSIIKKLLDEKRTVIPLADPYGTRPWIYIEDVVDALLLMQDKKANGQIFNVAGEERLNARYVGGLIAKIGDFGAVDFPLEGSAGSTHRFVRIWKMQKVFGWKPKVSMGTGLVETYRYFLHGA